MNRFSRWINNLFKRNYKILWVAVDEFSDGSSILWLHEEKPYRASTIRSYFSDGKITTFNRAFLPPAWANLSWKDGPKKIKVEVVK